METGEMSVDPPSYIDCWSGPAAEQMKLPKTMEDSPLPSPIITADLQMLRHGFEQSHLMYIRQNSCNVDIESLKRRPYLGPRKATDEMNTLQKKKKKNRTKCLIKVICKLLMTAVFVSVISLGVQLLVRRIPQLTSVNFMDFQQQQCMSCMDMLVLFNEQPEMGPLSLEDVQERFGEDDDEDSTGAGGGRCCVKSLQQQLELIDARSSQQPHEPGSGALTSPMKKRVAFHAILVSFDPPHDDEVTDFTDIPPAEWRFDEDLAFCFRGSSDNFCSRSFHSQGIHIPFRGRFTINVQVAWRSPYSDRKTTYGLQVSRLTLSRLEPRATEPRLLASEIAVRQRGQCSREPCAVAHITQTWRLRKGDHLIISVLQKGLVMDRSVMTFLEVTGESF